MARRLGWFVGAAGILLVLARLDQVLEPAVDTPDWRLIVPAACLGGILVTWATARLSPDRQLAIHLIALLVLLLRITVSDTLSFGIVPTGETLPALAERMAYAGEIVRFGAPPVLAVIGLVALVALGLWVVGAVWAWSVTSGRTWVGVAAPLGFYLYLAVVDRDPSTLPWHIAFAVVAGLGLVATSNAVPSGAGHLRSLDEKALPRWEPAPAGRIASVAAVVGVAGVLVFGGFVPEGGAINWRAPGGEGFGEGGGFTASRFVSLRQSIVSLSDEPVFVATVEPARPSGTAGYWRLLTLDHYTGQEWIAREQTFSTPGSGDVDMPDVETETITQTIRIESLRDDRLPSLYLPQFVEGTHSVIRSGTSLAGDGSLRVNARTFQGLSYRVESTVPMLDVDTLASSDGELTPLFAEAVEEGILDIEPQALDIPTRPAEIDSYLSLPPIDPAITQLAAEITAGASSPFERALMLEDFLRTFDYSTDVSTGHSSLDLAAWLTDPESPNYRTGYCEQFAAAMAVMGRVVSLPTRVVIGFTGGELIETPEAPLIVVRERNAHAWVEVWLDGQGWVGFDPTPRSDGATTPLAQTVGLDFDQLDEQIQLGEADLSGNVPDFVQDPGLVGVDLREGGAGGTSGGPRLSIVIGLTVALVLLAALPGIKAWRTGRRLRRARHGDITAVWEEIVDRLTDLGCGPSPHQTPLEFAEATSPELVPLAEAYSGAIYGGRQPQNVDDYLHAAGQWLDEAFERPERTRAVFSLRSLRR